MKICFVYEYYYPHLGGGETLMQRLAEGLASLGHDVSVITSQLPGTARKEKLNGVRVYRVPVPRFGDRYWFTVLGFKQIMKAAAEADIIQAATYNGAITAWIAARMKKKPVVLLPFEVLRDLWQKIGLNPAAALAYRIFERAILALPYDSYSCISENTRNVLLKSRIPPEKAFVAYPGIDYELFDPGKPGGRDEIRARLGVDEDTFLYMYTGRPGVVKGVEHLLDAVPEISRRIPGSRLMLLLSKTPPPKYREALKKVSELGRDVILMDPVAREELPRYFQASDCVIVP
ncbi:MAG: glycosyltransferase family 4 protein, partial [Thermoleophilia bacterium]